MHKPMGILLLLCGWMCLAGASRAAEAPAPVTKTAATATAVGAPVPLDKIEVWVGNEVITTMEIEEPLRQLREHYAQSLHGQELESKMAEARQLHVERLLESKLLLLEARDQKLEVQDAAVEQQVDKDIENAHAQFPSKEAFQEQLTKEHMTEPEFRKQREQMVREGMLCQRLLQEKVQEFKTGVEVTDQQMQEYYAKNQKKFRKPARAHVLQIFVGSPDTGLPAAEFGRLYQAAKDKIRRALAEIKSGKSFADVARRYSEHKLTADKGGDLGWIEEGDIDLPEFEKSVFSQLAVGQHSDVIETARGLFVVQLEDRQEGGEQTLSEVRGRIRMEMMNEGSEKRYKAWVDTLKKKFRVRFASEKNS